MLLKLLILINLLSLPVMACQRNSSLGILGVCHPLDVSSTTKRKQLLKVRQRLLGTWRMDYTSLNGDPFTLIEVTNVYYSTFFKQHSFIYTVLGQRKNFVGFYTNGTISFYIGDRLYNLKFRRGSKFVGVSFDNGRVLQTAATKI